MPESATDRVVRSGIVEGFDIEVNQVQDYEFLVRFDKPQFPELLVDAPRPIGRSAYPSPSRLLAAAVGHCSASVLLRCARRAGLALGSIEAKVDTRIVRDKRGLPRISKIEIMLDPHLSETQMRPAADALTGFEDLCLVTESVRNGIDVSCSVKGL